MTVDTVDVVHMVYETQFNGLRYTNSDAGDWTSELVGYVDINLDITSLYMGIGPDNSINHSEVVK